MNCTTQEIVVRIMAQKSLPREISTKRARRWNSSTKTAYRMSTNIDYRMNSIKLDCVNTSTK